MNIKTIGERVLYFCIAVCFLSVSLVWAQEKGYPNKAIEVIVPAGPGGGSDLCVRIITGELSSRLKIPFVITNLPGGAGLIGMTKVLKEKPDGYTLGSSASSTMTLSVIQTPKPPYDPFKDFLPVCGYGSGPIIFGVKSSSPFKGLQELIEYAKKNPAKLTCGIPSMGRENHLAFESLKKATGVNIKIVPFTATGDAVAALLGGHIDMMALSYIAFLPYIKSGETRALVATLKFPNSNIPSTTEIGYPKVNICMQYGFYISAKTPKEIYEKTVALFEGVVKDPNIAKKLESTGTVGQYKSPKEFTSDLKEEWDIVSEFAVEMGFKKQ